MPKPAARPVAISGVTTDQIRSAYYSGPAATNVALWVREMFLSPCELIVQNDSDDTLLRVAYTVASDGQITFSDGQPVKIEYINARAGIEKPVIAFASAVEARGPRRHLPAPPPPHTVAASAGRQTDVGSLSEQAEAKHQAEIVDAAIKDGKILSSRRDFYIKAMAEDPKGTNSVLAILAPSNVNASASTRSHAPDVDLSWFDEPPPSTGAQSASSAAESSKTAQSSWFSTDNHTEHWLTPVHSCTEAESIARSQADPGTDWFCYPPDNIDHR